MKNLYRNIVFSGLGYLLPLLASLLAIPLLVELMGADVYGLYAICISLIGFMAFADLGVGQAIIKFVSQYEVSGEQTKITPVLDLALCIYLCLGLSLAAALWLGAAPLGRLLSATTEQASLASSVLRVLALAFLLSYINQFFFNFYKAYHRFDIPSVLHNGANILGLGLSVALAATGFDLVVILWGYVLIYASVTVLAWLGLDKILTHSYRINLIRPLNTVLLREMLRFSTYTFVSNLMGAVTTRLDKLIVGILLGTQAVTYYHTAYTIAQMANGIIHSLSQIAFPRFSELVTLGKRMALQRLYRGALLITIALSMFINVMLLVVGEPFLMWWLGETPVVAQHAAILLKIMAIFFFVQSSTVVTYWVIQGMGQAKLIAVTSVITAAVYLMALYGLSQFFGYQGSAWALFTLLILYPLLFYWVERHIGVVSWEFFALLGLFALFGGGLWYLLMQVNAALYVGLGLSILLDGMIIILLTTMCVYAVSRFMGLLADNQSLKESS